MQIQLIFYINQQHITYNLSIIILYYTNVYHLPLVGDTESRTIVYLNSSEQLASPFPSTCTLTWLAPDRCSPTLHRKTVALFCARLRCTHSVPPINIVLTDPNPKPLISTSVPDGPEAGDMLQNSP